MLGFVLLEAELQLGLAFELAWELWLVWVLLLVLGLV